MKNYHLIHTTAGVMSEKFREYEESTAWELYNVYKKPSYYKQAAFNYCRQMMIDYNGNGLKIISYNTSVFTAGFIGYVDGQKAFFYITPTYNKYMFII